jgi:3-mercaptopyruvate sulfurtransferase SseA
MSREWSDMVRKGVPVPVLVFLLGTLLLVSCMPSTPGPAPETEPSTEAGQTQADTSLPSPSERVPRITVGELFQKMERGETILVVDTRVDVESAFEAGHIKGAVPVPLTKILDRQWVPDADTDTEIILYCT